VITTVARVDRDERMQQVCDAHAKPVFRFLLRLTFGDQQAAEDLLQETLLRAWKKIDGLNTDVDTLRPWLLTVARRIAIDAARAAQIRPMQIGSLDLNNLPATSDDCERVLAMQVVRQAMATLTPEHREVIFEIYFRGQSCANAAVRLGIPEGTVKSRTFLAMRALRAAVKNREGEQP
jgi:RNA polymerase sigma-70 factor (ECF subfamily)